MGGRATVRPVEMQVVNIVRLDVDGLAGARRPVRCDGDDAAARGRYQGVYPGSGARGG